MVIRSINVQQSNSVPYDSSDGDSNDDKNLSGRKSFADVLKGMRENEKAGELNNKQNSKMKAKADSAIKWLADYLHIPVNLLRNFLSDMNISMEDMADDAKIAEMVETICKAFNLDDKQKDEMKKKLSSFFK